MQKEMTRKSLFYEAIKNGDIETLVDVAKSQPDIVHSRTRFNIPVLYYAVERTSKKKADVIKNLIDRKADLEAATSFGKTALMCAATLGEQKIVRLLLDSKAKVTAFTSAQTTVLHSAVRGVELTGNWDIVKLLIEKQADPYAIDKDGDTPESWMNSIDTSYAEQFKNLLQKIGTPFLKE